MSRYIIGGALTFLAFLAFSSDTPQRTAGKPPHPDTCPGHVRPQPSAEAEGKAQTAIEKDARKFAAENGIKVKQQGDRLVFTLQAGREISLFSVEATADGLKNAAERLADLVDAKIKEVEKEFDVDFAVQDEVIEKQWIKNDKGEWERGNDVLARKPRLDELYGIESALYRAQPSHRAKGGGRGIKFYFLTDDITKGERPLATYRANRNGRPAIHYYPGSTEGRPALERDAKFDPTASLGHGYGSIEALTLHEISHNHQTLVGWWTDLEKDEAGKLGYQNLGTDKDGYTIWALESKKFDSNGKRKLYRLNDKTGRWYNCDDSGNAIAGEPELTKAEMRKIARHKPMTYYFPSPSEQYAEGVMIYRLGGVYRASLLKENPALHDVAKRLDQTEIDEAYGVDIEYETRQGIDQFGNQVWYQVEKSRTSRYIRNSDGKLVKNTKKNAEDVRKFEEDARKSK